VEVVVSDDEVIGELVEEEVRVKVDVVLREGDAPVVEDTLRVELLYVTSRGTVCEVSSALAVRSGTTYTKLPGPRLSKPEANTAHFATPSLVAPCCVYVALLQTTMCCDLLCAAKHNLCYPEASDWGFRKAAKSPPAPVQNRCLLTWRFLRQQ